MASDYVVLKVGEIFVVNSPLRHRTESSVDAVNYFLCGEIFQEIVAFLNFIHRQLGKVYYLAIEQAVFDALQADCKYLWHNFTIQPANLRILAEYSC